MKYDACTDCGVEKTGGQRQKPKCRPCAQRLAQLGRTRSPETCEKIGAVHRGKTVSPETRAKMSAAWKGNTNMLGKTCSLKTRRNISLAQGGDGDILNRKFPGLRRWTRLVKERDGYCCAECGYQGAKGKSDVDAHHVIPKSKFPDLATVLFNGVTLCKPCHKDIHATS
jgi:5-methylcytosine-specific restriction endonuclease McrA